MPRFKKKPIVVEAWCFMGDVATFNSGVTAPFVDVVKPANHDCEECGRPAWTHGIIATLEGNMIVCPGDWVIKGVKGEFYPCKPDIFKLTYERIE